MNMQPERLDSSAEAVASFRAGGSKPRVLLVDDDPTLLTSLRRRLQDNFDIRLAAGAQEALSLMQAQGPFAVIVTDMTMPGTDGATLLSEVKQFSPSTVRLMLTGHGRQPEVVDRAVNDCEVFRFLSKPCRPSDLDRALEDAVELHEQWRAAEILAGSGTKVPSSPRAFLSLRRFDTTTGLPNRRSFEVALLAALSERDVQAREPVLIHVDIDNFGLINEARGFTAGDALMRHVADVVLGAFATQVPVAKFSADEFGVLLCGEHASGTEEACKRLLAKIADSPFTWDGERLPISACAGIMPLVPGIEGVTAWLLAAETACAIAKRLGPGRIHAGGPQDPLLMRHQSERVWLLRAQQALEANRFRLLFQHIVPLQDTGRQGLHFELLLRLLHPSGSMVSPAAFMPATERYHLAGALDRWVVRNAFEWLAGESARLRTISLASLNISGGSLCDPEFISYLLELWAAGGIPAQKICLEVTETAAVTDIATAQKVMRDLRALGFRFALDDFGSGLCSFAYLKHLPVDYLKIDGTFVRQADRNATSRAMVQAINQIAQVMGKRTVAEFVENAAIMNVVRGLGVDFAQGYGIHRPAPLQTLKYQAEHN